MCVHRLGRWQVSARGGLSCWHQLAPAPDAPPKAYADSVCTIPLYHPREKWLGARGVAQRLRDREEEVTGCEQGRDTKRASPGDSQLPSPALLGGTRQTVCHPWVLVRMSLGNFQKTRLSDGSWGQVRAVGQSD